MPIEKRKLENIEIACWMNTREWLPGRRTLAFIHGSGGDHTAWVYQYGRLKGLNLAVLELPGHGQSGGKGEDTIAAYVEWAKAAFSAFGIERPVIVGHSLGAAIGLTFAVRYGELISGVVAVGGGARMPVNPLILDGVRKDPAAVLAMTAKFAVAKKHRERLSAILAERDPNPEVLYGDFLACDRHDITESLGKIAVPTLIVCGSEDKMTPMASSEYLRDHIPGAALTIIPEAGHMVMMEEPDAFNEVIRTFAEGLSPG